MSTDYQIAKSVVEIAMFEKKIVVVDNVEVFRRYLSQIAKKAGMEFITKKAVDGLIILRIS